MKKAPAPTRPTNERTSPKIASDKYNRQTSHSSSAPTNLRCNSSKGPTQSLSSGANLPSVERAQTNQRKQPSKPSSSSGANLPSVERAQTTQRKQPQPPKPTTEKWATSEGKKYLEKELKDASSKFHKMSIEQIHATNNCFRGFPLKNFKTNYNNLKRRIEATAARVEFDNNAVREHAKKFPRQPKTNGGYPHWDTHQAKKDLERDVCNGIACLHTPRELWATNKFYQEFPPDIFCKRVHAEMQKQRGAAFWVEKRNRAAMKQRLTEVGEIK
jgi:hypothetical protein